MEHYYIHVPMQTNADQQVHRQFCRNMPPIYERIYLGLFWTAADAINEAKKKYSNAIGCPHCCPSDRLQGSPDPADETALD